MKQLSEIGGPYGGAIAATLFGVGGSVVPGWHAWAASWLAGALVGGVNVFLMARALRRGTEVVLAPAGAMALAAGGIARFLVVVGLLVWVGTELRALAPAALLGGYFVPEVTFVVHVLRRNGAAVPKGDVE